MNVILAHTCLCPFFVGNSPYLVSFPFSWVNFILFLFFFFFFLLGLHVWHMEVPRLKVELELQLSACAIATATPDPSCVYDLYHSSGQHQTHWAWPGIEPVSSWIIVWFVTAEPQQELPVSVFIPFSPYVEFYYTLVVYLGRNTFVTYFG